MELLILKKTYHFVKMTERFFVKKFPYFFSFLRTLFTFIVFLFFITVFSLC